MNSTATSRQNYTVFTEDDREVHALKEWINALLLPPGLDVENSTEVERLLEKTNEANSKLKEILMSLSQLPTRMNTPQKLNVLPKTPQKFNTPQKSRLAAAAESMDSVDLSTLRQKRLNEQWRNKTIEFYNSSDIPRKIFQLVDAGQVGVRKGLVVFTHIGLQVDLLTLLLNFHPIWLKLALETVFGVEILLPETANAVSTQRKFRFVPTIANFIRQNLFTNEALVKRGKSLIASPDVVFLIHKHFLSKLCQVLFTIENMVIQAVVPNMPCMFLKSSQYKCMHDVYGYLSREIIAGSYNLPKMLARVGFEAKYKQGFFEEYNYQVDSLLADLSDGIILAKVIETLSAKDGYQLGTLIARLRNPSGDRIRKIYNMKVVLAEAAIRFPEKFQIGGIKAEDIVGAKRSVVVKFVLQLADIQESKAVLKIQGFLRSALRRREGLRVIKANNKGHWIQRKRAANLIQVFLREQIFLCGSAITIQAFMRRFIAISCTKEELYKLTMRRQLVEEAAICVQSLLRTAVVQMQFLDHLMDGILAPSVSIRRISALRLAFLATNSSKFSGFQIGGIKAEGIVSAKRSVVVKFVLQLADIQESKAVLKIQGFLRIALRRHEVLRTIESNNEGHWIQRERAANFIQVFLREQIFICQSAITIQAFIRRFTAISCAKEELYNLMMRRPLVEKAAICVQSLLRAAVVQMRFLDHLMDGILDPSLSIRRISALRLASLTTNSSKFANYLLNNGTLGVLMDSIAELGRGHPNVFVLRPISQTIFNILTNSMVEAGYHFFEDLVENSVKQIYNNYKDDEMVVTNARILKILKPIVGFREILAKTRYDWYLDQFEKQFARLDKSNARYVVYNEILKFMEK